MKTTKTYWLLAAALTIAGCASDNELTTDRGDDNEAVNVIATRTASSASSSSTTLAQGETFRLVNITRQGLQLTTKYDATYQVTADGIEPVTATDYVVWQTGKDGQGNAITQNTFNAVIPATADYDSFTVPTDQSTADKLKAADWQTASATHNVTAMAAKPSVELNFGHQLAQIVITVGDDVKSDFSSLTDLKVLGDITPFYSPNDRTIKAIVEPTTIFGSTTLLSFTDATGEAYALPVPSSISSIDKGKLYNFTLTGGHDAMSVTVSVTEWTSANVDANNEIWTEDTRTFPYVTFSANAEQGFKMTTSSSSYKITGLQYSVGNGPWIYIPINGTSNAVTFGGSRGDLRLRGTNLKGTAIGPGSYSTISFTDDNVKVSCTGDIRTLLDFENYKTVDTSNARFCGLFRNCKQLTSAPELPAMILADYCYASMFLGCTALIQAPELPAMTLAEKCYYSMFEQCKALTQAPKLPATTLAANCYYQMFFACEALTEAPSELPATTLASACYASMFRDCSALKKAPELRATTLALACYNEMFGYCSSLEEAPELRATTLAESCYNYMFEFCDKLNKVKMLATDVSAYNCLGNWLIGAGRDATSRTLVVKSEDAYNSISGNLPDIWKKEDSGTTVKDADGNPIQ